MISPMMMKSELPPQLTIMKLNCLAHEPITDDSGENLLVCVVVKHSPFLVQLGIDSGDPRINLKSYHFETKLLYDTPDQKEVDLPGMKPLEYKLKVDDQNILNVDCRLRVLTSQLEDMHFRLKIIALDPITKCQVTPPLVAISEPIKVISKPEQIRKAVPATGQKRKANDLLLSGLELFEQQQRDQASLLQQLQNQVLALKSQQNPNSHQQHQQIYQNMAMQQNQQLPLMSMSSSSSSIPTHPRSSNNNINNNNNTSNPAANDQPEEKYTIEEAFKETIELFSSIPPEERAKRMRNVLQSVPLSSQYIREVIDVFASQGLSIRSTGMPTPQMTMDGSMNNPYQINPIHDETNPECLCQMCPHREELKRIQEFYNVFL
eukprot:TRINITY_DN8596_c0_g1_i1.p1 TRINITY_DN8596_c0_g1~~TRINITY_DN8596_c0_g1_i1.p1  ORF type:complete len:402 (+),score=116.41 TRINITY_DN8596_c0_g1_i1:76-1206(+)